MIQNKTTNRRMAWLIMTAIVMLLAIAACTISTMITPEPTQAGDISPAESSTVIVPSETAVLGETPIQATETAITPPTVANSPTVANTDTPEPSDTPTETPTATDTATVTATPTHAPATPTQLPSPTPLTTQGASTPVVVTPLGGQPTSTAPGGKWDTEDLPIGATYTTYNVMKIRSTPEIRTDNILAKWGPGARLAYGVMYSGTDNKDSWACIDQTCTQLIAIVNNGTIWGTLGGYEGIQLPNLHPKLIKRSHAEMFTIQPAPGVDWRTILVEGLIVLLAVCAIIASTVSAFKAKGWIEDGEAGKLNVAISTIMSVITAVLLSMGSQVDLKNLNQIAVGASGLIVLIFTYAGGSKLVYMFLHWLGFAYAHPEPRSSANMPKTITQNLTINTPGSDAPNDQVSTTVQTAQVPTPPPAPPVYTARDPRPQYMEPSDESDSGLVG